MKYRVKFNYHTYWECEVEANSAEEAVDKAEDICTKEQDNGLFSKQISSHWIDEETEVDEI